MYRWHEVTFDDLGLAAPKRDRLQKAIRESKSIAMLAGNPLLLTMMAVLNRNQELPRDRTDLYAQVSRLLLHQWDTERALADFPGISNEIGLREKTDILRRIAAHMQAAPGGLKGNLIDGPTLTGLIEDYLQKELHFPRPAPPPGRSSINCGSATSSSVSSARTATPSCTARSSSISAPPISCSSSMSPRRSTSTASSRCSTNTAATMNGARCCD